MKKTDLVLIILFYLIFSFSNIVSIRRGELEVEVWDVGQGDSIFITTPHGKNILIDGGDNYEADFKLSSKMPFYSCYIDLMVLTHPHYDHINGLNRVLQRCGVGAIMFNDVYFSSTQYEEFKHLTKDIEKENVFAGNKFEIDNVKLIILWPTKNFLQNKIADINDVSVVILLDYGDFEMLLTGDATNKVLGNIDTDGISPYIQGGFDVLKVPHHGSKYSLHDEFYTRLNPSTCVISVGKNNKFNHPSPTVIEYFEKIGCKVLRTDLKGDVKIKIR